MQYQILTRRGFKGRLLRGQDQGIDRALVEADPRGIKINPCQGAVCRKFDACRSTGARKQLFSRPNVGEIAAPRGRPAA